MGTLDIIISRDQMLASPANYKLWRTTMEHVFEKEDLRDFFEPMTSQTGGASSGTTGASETITATTSTRQEQELERKQKRRAFSILKLSLSEGP